MKEQRDRNVPKIRFKGFDSGWEKKTLGELCEPLSYGLNAAAMKFDGTNKYLRITDIDDESRAFRQGDLTSPKKDLSTSENYVLKSGDIVFARTGASVGKTYLYKEEDGHVFFAGFLIRAKTKVNVDEGFVFQNTLTSQFEAFVKLTSQRSGQPGINAQEYSDYSLNCPASEEQTKIGEYFRELDRLTGLHQRKHDKLVTLKKAMLQKMFPQAGATTPEIRFKGFEGEWFEKPLHYLASRYDNLRIPVTASNRIPGNVPYYGANGIQDYVQGCTHEGEFILVAEDGANDLKNYPVQHVSGKIWVNNHAHVLQGKDGLAETRFLKYAFSQINVEVFLVGGGRAKLNAETMMQMKLCVPTDLAEQKKIGNYFRQLDELICKHAIQLKKLQQIKTACLEKMFV